MNITVKLDPRGTDSTYMCQLNESNTTVEWWMRGISTLHACQMLGWVRGGRAGSETCTLQLQASGRDGTASMATRNKKNILTNSGHEFMYARGLHGPLTERTLSKKTGFRLLLLWLDNARGQKQFKSNLSLSRAESSAKAICFQCQGLCPLEWTDYVRLTQLLAITRHVEQILRPLSNELAWHTKQILRPQLKRDHLTHENKYCDITWREIAWHMKTNTATSIKATCKTRD